MSEFFILEVWIPSQESVFFSFFLFLMALLWKQQKAPTLTFLVPFLYGGVQAQLTGNSYNTWKPKITNTLIWVTSHKKFTPNTVEVTETLRLMVWKLPTTSEGCNGTHLFQNCWYVRFSFSPSRPLWSITSGIGLGGIISPWLVCVYIYYSLAGTSKCWLVRWWANHPHQPCRPCCTAAPTDSVLQAVQALFWVFFSSKKCF